MSRTLYCSTGWSKGKKAIDDRINPRSAQLLACAVLEATGMHGSGLDIAGDTGQHVEASKEQVTAWMAALALHHHHLLMALTKAHLKHHVNKAL
jgi:hypothetical protein